MELRENMGMSQAELAKKTNVTSAFISMLERGVRSCNRSTVEDIAVVLKYDPAKLWGIAAREKISRHKDKLAMSKPGFCKTCGTALRERANAKR
jgi:transcriptional regulator with XRE-family HTH domain